MSKQDPQIDEEAECAKCAETIVYTEAGWCHEAALDVEPGKDDGYDHDAEPSTCDGEGLCGDPMCDEREEYRSRSHARSVSSSARTPSRRPTRSRTRYRSPSTRTTTTASTTTTSTRAATTRPSNSRPSVWPKSHGGGRETAAMLAAAAAVGAEA